MLKDDVNFDVSEIPRNHYISLGTPEQVIQFQYTFLFDLDGTLVHTDHVYVKVWNKILNRYNLHVDELFFDNFIKGKSDDVFLKFLIPTITDTIIQQISDEKDKLFIELLHQEDNILVKGVLDFMNSIKHCNIAIVTNCNRPSATYILEKTGINRYCKFLVAAGDCGHSKPHPEPYMSAMKFFRVPSTQCIVFEDTFTGYLSAHKGGVNKIVMVTHNKTTDDVKDLKCKKISDYRGFRISDVVLDSTTNDDLYSEHIRNALSYLPIKEVKMCNENIKTGYICDIDSYDVVFNSGESCNVILKISNLDNSLSDTAIQLNMYKNEEYFYSHLSKLVNLNVPEYYGVIEHNGKTGILMGDLNRYSGSFGRNLNTDINLLLRIVCDISKMHNKFLVVNETKLIQSMKPLLTVNKIGYYKILIEERFEKFMTKNDMFISDKCKRIFNFVHDNFSDVVDVLSTYPLTLCHGDLKSPNIFYKNDQEPYYLDWQYVHLNKGVSDIIFLLIESLEFDEHVVEIVVRYYYQLVKEHLKISYSEYIEELKMSLFIFPFFVCVWFNSEDNDKLLDSSFPMRFMKNLMKYYEYFIG